MESLRGMISFVQTARSGSFVKAAEVLGVSPVAVSKNVSRLEGQLGVRLFARTTRHLSVTAEGAALLARCEGPLAQLSDAFAGSRRAADEPEGIVRMTSVTPFVRNYLAANLVDFHRRYPKVVLHIECAEQITDLVAGGFDLGVRIGQLNDAAYVARPLGPLELVLCASPSFLARTGLPEAPEAMAQMHGLGLHIAGQPEPTPWRLLGDQGLTAVPVAGPFRCNDMSALASACVAGLGVAQLPLVVALPALNDGQLQVLWPQRAPRGLQLFLHYPDRQLPARVRVVVDFVLGYTRQHPDLAVKAESFGGLPGGVLAEGSATPRPTKKLSAARPKPAGTQRRGSAAPA